MQYQHFHTCKRPVTEQTYTVPVRHNTYTSTKTGAFLQLCGSRIMDPDPENLLIPDLGSESGPRILNKKSRMQNEKKPFQCC
jgi:hypothetical protein